MSAHTRGLLSALRIVSIALIAAGCATVALAQASFTTITDFPTFESSGTQAALVEGADGAFYGTTLRGGANSCNCGTVYRVDRYGVVDVLHAFAGIDGACPSGALVADGRGSFYGTASGGGTYGSGVIFSITPDVGYTVLHALNNLAATRQGSTPSATLVRASDGHFYGSTRFGGAYGSGTIFRITSGGAFDVLHALADSAQEGRDLRGGLAESADGRLYRFRVARRVGFFGRSPRG